jgi:inosose dehydratase
MDPISALSRRSLLRGGVSAAALSLLAGRSSLAGAEAAAADARRGDPWLGLLVGVASYTFNRFPLDVTIEAIRRVGVNYVSIKDKHLPMKSTGAERQEVARLLKVAGLRPLSCGVVTLSDDESEIRNAFEYARDTGFPTIVSKPTRKSLPVLDRMVKEFDIKVAIHNHGPEDKVWPSPYDAWDAIQDHDPRIGVCIDVGHTARCKVDPAEAIRKCSARLYDLHIKDIDGPDSTAKPIEVGRGVLDVRGMLQALLDIKYGYHVGLEYERDLREPLPGVAESIGYIRGTLAGLKRS